MALETEALTEAAGSRARFVPWILAATAAALYFYRLGDTPMRVGGDEALFAINAHAIATTGRDLDGHLLPLFFKVDLKTWYQPALVYLMALAFSLFHVSEWSMRAPMALVAVIDVVLVYAIGLRLFGRRRYAVLAAVMMALSPPHLILARQALDYVLPLPFILGWLWCLLVAIESGSAGAALAAGLWLGVGFYSYIAAWITMPVLFVITLITLRVSGSRGRVFALAALGFAAPFALLLVWVQIHPDTLGTMFARYGLSDGASAQGVRNLLHYYVIQARLSLYWAYFDPVFLFLAGSPNVTISTAKAGVFLVPAAVLLPVGIYDILRRSDRSLVLLAGFLSAPLAPVIINTGSAIQRELGVVVFGVLISVYGAKRLFASSRPLVRAAAAVLVIAMPLQFTYFANDYFTGYRVRAANWLDPINADEIAKEVIARDGAGGVPRIYLSESLDDIEARWRFYLAKYDRGDLWRRTWIVDAGVRHMWSVDARLLPEALDEHVIPPRSLFVVGPLEPGTQQLTDADRCCQAVRAVHGASGEVTALMVERRPTP